MLVEGVNVCSASRRDKNQIGTTINPRQVHGKTTNIDKNTSVEKKNISRNGNPVTFEHATKTCVLTRNFVSCNESTRNRSICVAFKGLNYERTIPSGLSHHRDKNMLFLARNFTSNEVQTKTG